MKKYIILFFLFTLVFFVSGCEKKTETIRKTEKKILKFTSWGSKSEIAVIKPLIKKFEEQNPDIDVKLIHTPKNYFQKLHLLIASDLTPDVIFLNNIYGPLYAENNIFMDLSIFLEKDEVLSKNDFFPKVLKTFKYKETLYAIPRDVSNLVIYYNKDIFDKYKVQYPSVDWTFEEFINTCKKLDINNNEKNEKTDIGEGLHSVSTEYGYPDFCNRF